MDIDREMRNQGLIPVAEAVERLGVSLRTIRRWTRDGEVRTRKVLGRVWLDEASLLRRIGVVQAD
jgi:excisionase family DNA binding protein